MREQQAGHEWRTMLQVALGLEVVDDVVLLVELRVQLLHLLLVLNAGDHRGPQLAPRERVGGRRAAALLLLLPIAPQRVLRRRQRPLPVARVDLPAAGAEHTRYTRASTYSRSAPATMTKQPQRVIQYVCARKAAGGAALDVQRGAELRASLLLLHTLAQLLDLLLQLGHMSHVVHCLCRLLRSTPNQILDSWRPQHTRYSLNRHAIHVRVTHMECET